MNVLIDINHFKQVGVPFIISLSPLNIIFQWFPKTGILIIAILGGILWQKKYSGLKGLYGEANTIIEFFNKHEAWQAKLPKSDESDLNKMKTEWGRRSMVKWQEKINSIENNRFNNAQKNITIVINRMKEINPQSPLTIEVENKYAEIKNRLKIE
jgi:hypothetical protein